MVTSYVMFDADYAFITMMPADAPIMPQRVDVIKICCCPAAMLIIEAKRARAARAAMCVRGALLFYDYFRRCLHYYVLFI